MKKYCEAGLPLFCSRRFSESSVVQSVSAVLMLEAMLYNKLLWRVPNRGAITIAWCGEISPRLQRSYLYFCKIVIMPSKVLNFNCIYNSLIATIWKITFVELFFSSAQNVFSWHLSCSNDAMWWGRPSSWRSLMTWLKLWRTQHQHRPKILGMKPQEVQFQ